MVFKQIKLITNTTIRNLYMQARKQNSNNAKDKLKLFEILQNKEKKRKESTESSFPKSMHTLNMRNKQHTKILQTTR